MTLSRWFTGILRCGKPYLLNVLFYHHLLENGVPDDHIIRVDLEDRMNKDLGNPDAMLHYVRDRIRDKKLYYIIIDEVQLMDEFVDVLNSFCHIGNADTYITGSNSRFLSSDIPTEFCGRRETVHVNPLIILRVLFDQRRGQAGRMARILYLRRLTPCPVL